MQGTSRGERRSLLSLAVLHGAWDPFLESAAGLHPGASDLSLHPTLLDLDVSPAMRWRRSKLPPSPSAAPGRVGVMSRPVTGPTPLCARRGEARSPRCGGG